MLNLFGKNAFARKRKAKAMPIETISRIETLEDRVVLASQVAVVYDAINGNLTLSGSGFADDVTVTITGTNQVAVTGNGGTTLIGYTGPYNVSGNLSVDLGNSNATQDTLNIIGGLGGGKLDSGNVIIDMGSGTDIVNIGGTGSTALEFTGDVTIIGGTGADTVNVGATATVEVLNLNVDTGTEATSFAETVLLDRLTANGNVTIFNGGRALQRAEIGSVNAAPNTILGNLTIVQTNVANTGGYTASARNTTVSGNVSITNGSGTGNAGITLTATATTTVTGTTTLTNGVNTGVTGNTITLNGAAAPNTLTLTGKITATNGNSLPNVTAATANSIVVDGVVVSGASSAAFTNGSAAAGNTIDIGDTRAVTLTGNAYFTNGSTTTLNNEIDINSLTVSRLSNFTNGTSTAADNIINLGDDGGATAVNLVGNAVLKNGTAAVNNTVDIDVLNADANVTISNGVAGASTVTIGTGTNTIDGNLSITNLNTTAGLRTTTIDALTVSGRTGLALNNVGAGNFLTEIGRNVAVTVVITGKLDIQDGTGGGTLTTERLTVGSITFNDLGGGSEIINLGNTNVGTTTVNGVTRINAGAGGDTLNIGNIGAVFNGLVAVSMGSGNDTIDIGANASSPAFSSADKFQFDGGSGDDTFNADPLSLSSYDPLNLPTLPRKLRSKITNFEHYGV